MNGLSSGISGADLLNTMFSSYLCFCALLPLAADQRRRAHVLHRVLGTASLPGDRPDQRVVVGRGDGVADRLGLQRLGPLQAVDRDLEVGVLEADRLGPLLAGRGLVGVAELLRGLAGEVRLERVVMRPPNLGRHARAAIAQRLDRGREQQRLGRRHDLRPIALLGALGPEDRELRRVEDAAAHLAIRLLQLGDLRGEVVRQRRVEPQIMDVEPFGA